MNKLIIASILTAAFTSSAMADAMPFKATCTNKDRIGPVQFNGYHDTDGVTHIFMDERAKDKLFYSYTPPGAVLRNYGQMHIIPGDLGDGFHRAVADDAMVYDDDEVWLSIRMEDNMKWHMRVATDDVQRLFDYTIWKCELKNDF